MASGPWKETAGREVAAKLDFAEVNGVAKSDEVTLTIKRCYVQRIGREAQLCIEFVEFAGKAMRCNKTQAAAIQSLVGHGHLPDTYNETMEEFIGWEGLSLPLFKKKIEWTDTQTGEIQDHYKYYAVSPVTFDKSLVDFPRIGTSKANKAKKGTTRKK